MRTVVVRGREIADNERIESFVQTRCAAMEPQHFTLLRMHDTCCGMTREQVDQLAEVADVVGAEAGEVIHASDESVEALHIVVSGRLKMLTHTPTGGHRIVRYISAGDQFGAMTLATGHQIPVDVVVDEKAVLIRVKKEDVFRLVETIPLMRRNLLRKIGISVGDALHWRRIRVVSKIVLLIATDDQAKSMASGIVSRLIQIGERVGVLAGQRSELSVENEAFSGSLLNQSGKCLEQDEIQKIVDQMPETDRLCLVVDPSFPRENLERLFHLADVAFCIAASTSSDASLRVLEGLVGNAPSLRKKMNLVSLLQEDQQVAPNQPRERELTQRCFVVPHALPAMRRGIERIIHHLRDVSIGLALSGGAAHGMAHLGVLRALEEAGITFDRLAGTSAGTLTGVIYCAGFTPEWGIESFTRDLEPGAIYKWFPKGDGLYLLEKYRTHSWGKMLRKYLRDWRLEQMLIPISTVTTDLVQAEQVARSKGDAVDAILESINLPVVSPPICCDGRLLVDGGIINNLPADLLVNEGCNFVIGVDVAAHVEKQVGGNTPETSTDDMKAPGIVSTMLRCLRVQAHNMSAIGASPADVIIAPDVSDFAPTAFSKTPEMAEVGYQAAVDALPRIKEILSKLDGDLFA